MKFFSYLRVELNRIFHSKMVYLIMVLTMLCPMAGYKLYNDGLLDETVSGHFIGNPSLAGALGGGILFAVLTLLQFNEVHKYKTDVLTNSIVSPLILNVVRLFGMGIVALITVSITSIIYYPYTVIKMGSVFELYTYLNCFFLLILPSVLLSIFAASAFYQIFHRVELSMAAFIVFMLPNLIKYLPIGNIMRWIKPSVPGLSDYFGSKIVFRLMEHNRLFWFLMLGGVWLIGNLCVRTHGKGLFGSIVRNSRKVYIPLSAIAMISGAFYAFVNQPDIYMLSKNQIAEVIEAFNDRSEDSRYKVNKEVQLLNSDFKISFNDSNGSLCTKVVYSFENLSDNEQECKLRINPGYTIKQIKINNDISTLKKLDTLEANASFTIPTGKNINVTMEYEGRPKIFYLVSDDILDTNISDKYISLTSSDLISNILTANDKENSALTAQLTMPAGLMPIVNPAQKDEKSGREAANLNGDSTKLISEDGNKKTWLVQLKGTTFNLVAGDYVMKQFGSEETPIQFYYNSKHEVNMKTTSAEKVMKDTINYCINHYGKLNNATKNSPLKIVEQTALVPGGLGYPNYSTMSETCFSEDNLNNKLKGSSSAEVLSHELAHQWFGVETVGWGGNNKNWSAEGLAVYTTYRVAKETYGEEYAKENYVEKWKATVKDRENDFYNRHPEYLNVLPEKYATRVDDYNRVANLYSRLPLQILKAAELVGGEDKMDKILAKLYENSSKEKITWQGFLDACNLKEEDLNLD